MLAIKDIYYLCQQNQAAHSESGEAVIIFYSRWDIEGYARLPSGLIIQWGIISDLGSTFRYIPFSLPVSSSFVVTSLGKADMQNWSPYNAQLAVNCLDSQGFYIGRTENTASSYACWLAVGY